MASENETTSLDLQRSRKFLRTIAEEPFVALVVTSEGEVRIFSKDIEPGHLERIREVLKALKET